MPSLDFETRMYCRCVGKGDFYPCSRSFVVQGAGREEWERGEVARGRSEEGEEAVEGRASLAHVHPCFGARCGEVSRSIKKRTCNANFSWLVIHRTKRC